MIDISDVIVNNLIIAILAIIMAVVSSRIIIPHLIAKMKSAGHYAIDVNKKSRPKIPDMGGMGFVLAICVTLIIMDGLMVLFNIYEPSNIIYIVVSVVLIASYIGLFDDIGVISRRSKAIALILAGFPLAFTQPVNAQIIIPLMGDLQIDGFYPIHLIFWLIVVPFGVFTAGNAFNLSAGYNGIESGQTVIISFTLLVISIILNSNGFGVLIFAATFGASLVLYYFNRYPAKTFVGDIGTLSMGVLIATGAIFAGLEIFAIILILPMFYEAFASAYYSLKKIERKWACMHPKINGDGTLQPPKGAEKYTLFFYLLGKKPMTEKTLVNNVIYIYIILGLITLILSIQSAIS